MLQRDYIMRLIRTFFEALEKLFDGKQQDDHFAEDLDTLYNKFLGQSREWFLSHSIEETLLFLNQDSYPLEKAGMLAEALFREFEDPTSSVSKTTLSEKITTLYHYIDNNSTDYSLLRDHRLNALKRWQEE